MPASWLRPVVLLAVLASLAAPVRAQTTPSVSLAITNISVLNAIDFIADDLGLWTKRGLQVKIILLPGAASPNAVIAGSVAFGHASGNTLTRAAAHGQKLLGIIEYIDRPLVEIAFRKDLATAGGFDPKAPLAQRAALLRGRTIAVDSLNSNIHAYANAVARLAGIGRNELRIAPMAPPEMLASLESHAIDGFAFTPPWPEREVANGNAVILASGIDQEPADLSPSVQTMLVALPKTCTEHADWCHIIGDGLTEAAAILRDKPDVALAVVKKRLPKLEDALLKDSLDVVRKATPNPLAVSRAGLANSEKMNVQAGFLPPGDVLTNYDSLFSTAFVQPY